MKMYIDGLAGANYCSMPGAALKGWSREETLRAQLLGSKLLNARQILGLWAWYKLGCDCRVRLKKRLKDFKSTVASI